MPPVPFAKVGAPLSFSKESGLCFGWFCFSKQNGEPYIDLHGDHFPDDELIAAVDELMAKPASEREINVEHAGAGRGQIATAQALTEDVAKALKIDTGGTYGVFGSFRPDAELLKSIKSGAMFCLSVEGKALDVEIVKSADGIAATAHKRTLRKLELTKLAVVKAGAHEGAAVAIVKALGADDLAKLRRAAVAKRTAGMTSAEAGHQHLIFDADAPDGFTDCAASVGAPCGHSHPFVRNPDGALVIGEADGHSHTLLTPSTAEPDMPTDLEKTQATQLVKAELDLAAAKAAADKLTADVADLVAALGTAAKMDEDEKEVAKALAPDALRAFLRQPAEIRKSRATPIYKGADGASYYPGEERMGALAKRADEGERTTIAAGFEKRALAEIPNLKGTVGEHAAILKAVDGIADETVRKAVLETLRGANAAMGSLFKAQGVGSGPGPTDALDAFDKGLETFAKAIGKPAEKVADDFLATPEGARLYAAYDAARIAR